MSKSKNKPTWPSWNSDGQTAKYIQHSKCPQHTKPPKTLISPQRDDMKLVKDIEIIFKWQMWHFMSMPGHCTNIFKSNLLFINKKKTLDLCATLGRGSIVFFLFSFFFFHDSLCYGSHVKSFSMLSLTMTSWRWNSQRTAGPRPGPDSGGSLEFGLWS